MKDRAADRIPPYVPWTYRAFLKVRKSYRQHLTRAQERAAARRPLDPLLADGEPAAGWSDGVPVPNPRAAVSKCARWMDEDLVRPDVKAIVEALVALKAALTRRGLRFTNTAGNFLPRLYHPETERGKLWEDAWVLRHSDIRPGQRVLDVGGASTIFSFYLASLGCRMVVVDNDWANCGTLYNARYVARQMGWDLAALDRDVSKPLPFQDGSFDRAFSICVLEHLPPAVRQFAMREMGRVLAPDGIAGFTTDFDAGRPVLVTDKGLRFAYRDKFERDVLRPSGLQPHGIWDWTDAHPREGFLGAFLLHKPAAPPAR